MTTDTPSDSPQRPDAVPRNEAGLPMTCECGNGCVMPHQHFDRSQAAATQPEPAIRDARGELQALLAFSERMPWVYEDQRIVLDRARKALAALTRPTPSSQNAEGAPSQLSGDTGEPR